MVHGIYLEWAVTLVALGVLAVLNSRKGCERRGVHMNGVFTLPDVVHSMFQKRDMYGYIAEAVYIVMLVVVGYLVAKGEWGYLLLYLQMYIVVLVFNILFAVVTVLPDSKRGDCYPSGRIVGGFCNDLGFSAHLATTAITLLVISLYHGHRYIWIYLVMLGVMAFAIAASRNHYTIDCLTALVVCALIASNVRLFPAFSHIKAGRG